MFQKHEEKNLSSVLMKFRIQQFKLYELIPRIPHKDTEDDFSISSTNELTSTPKNSKQQNNNDKSLDESNALPKISNSNNDTHLCEKSSSSNESQLELSASQKYQIVGSNCDLLQANLIETEQNDIIAEFRDKNNNTFTINENSTIEIKSDEKKKMTI